MQSDGVANLKQSRHVEGARPRGGACGDGYRLVPGLLLCLVALVVAGCSADSALAVYLQMHQDQLQRGASTTASPVQFTVEPGESARAVGQQLQSAGLIRDGTLFEAYVRVNGLASRLEAGTFTLNAAMTPVQIAVALQHARAASITVTIPEGWRLEQVADYLGAAGVLDGAAYRRLAASGQAGAPHAGAYDFLGSRPAGASLEGYLFPDTYELPKEGATASDLIDRQLDDFAAQVVPLYQQARAGGATTLSLYEAVTLASIVEREAVVDDERPVIAGVYANRLARGMKLEADPTVQYAMGYQARSGQWWKTPVSIGEYAQVLSPYNTYLHPGLPPGPIANPGLASILAALHPAKHDYLYFVALPDGSGRHVFAKTFAEHQENVARYLGVSTPGQ